MQFGAFMKLTRINFFLRFFLPKDEIIKSTLPIYQRRRGCCWWSVLTTSMFSPHQKVEHNIYTMLSRIGATSNVNKMNLLWSDLLKISFSDIIFLDMLKSTETEKWGNTYTLHTVPLISYQHLLLWNFTTDSLRARSPSLATQLLYIQC